MNNDVTDTSQAAFEQTQKIRSTGTVQDISEYKQLEEQLLQAIGIWWSFRSHALSLMISAGFSHVWKV